MIRARGMDYIDDIHELFTNFNVFLVTKNQHIDNLSDEVNTQNPSEMRISYEDNWEGIDRSARLDKVFLEKLDNITENLNESKELVRYHIEKINEIKKKLNKTKTGTLEGLARDKIEEYGTVPDEEDYVAATVLSQPYDERAALDRGGRKRRTKRNRINRKNKKSRISRRKRR